MKLIKMLEEHIGEEIHDTKEYAKMAVEYKDEYPDLAELFYKLSAEEKRHADMLHDMAVNEIEKYRKMRGEPPAEMQAVYNYIHNQHMKKAEKAERYRAMYKEAK